MSQVNLKARSGNAIVVLFDGKQVGGIKSVSLNDDYSPEPVTQIGDIEVKEWVPTVARHTISVQSLVLRVGTLREAGITAENGNDMLVGKVFDIVVIANDDGKQLRKYTGCSYASGEITVTANAIVVASGQFNALSVVGQGA